MKSPRQRFENVPHPETFLRAQMTERSMSGSGISLPALPNVPSTKGLSTNSLQSARKSDGSVVVRPGADFLNPELAAAAIEFGHKLAGIPGADTSAPITEVFAKNLYGRLLPIKAGQLVAGRIHKFQHINFLVYGTVEVFDSLGNRILTGPHIEVSPGGISRITHAQTDALLAGFFANVPEGPDMLNACTWESLEQYQKETESCL